MRLKALAVIVHATVSPDHHSLTPEEQVLEPDLKIYLHHQVPQFDMYTKPNQIYLFRFSTNLLRQSFTTNIFLNFSYYVDYLFLNNCIHSEKMLNIW